LKSLFAELNATGSQALHEDLDDFVAAVEQFPPGLRAMAATYQFDVSMTLDDLGWHFANWHHHGYAAETSLGLKELEALEAADIFDQAYSIVEHQWDLMTELLRQSFDAFTTWYHTSELAATLMPLNRRLWDLLDVETAVEPAGVFRYWVAYARKYPDRVVL
jgi:hypothetical protein